MKKLKISFNFKLTARERNLLEGIERVARKTSFRWAVVGGWVRDKYLGMDSADLDLVVYEGPGKPEEWAAQFSYALSEKKIEPYGKSKSYLVKREGLLLEITATKAPLDYGNPQAPLDQFHYGVGLEEDSRYRDLKINALYYVWATKDLWDFQGGTVDLREKKISLVGKPGNNLRYDPIRILRLLRFAHKLWPLGFSIAPSTREAMKKYGTHLTLAAEGGHPKVFPERIWGELKKILVSPHCPVLFFERLKRLDLLDRIFPRAAGCLPWDMDQKNKYHHLSLWRHTLMTLRVVSKQIRKNPEYYSEDDQIILKLAAFLHDVGKMDIQGGFVQEKIDEEGKEKRSFIGHSEGSARQAEIILNRLGLYGENRIKKKIVKLILYHLYPHQLDPQKLLSVKRFVRKMGEETPLVLDLCEADRKSHAKNFQDLEKMQQLREKVEEAGIRDILDLRPLLNGHEIIKLARKDHKGTPPPSGPWIGKIIRELMDEQLEGRLSTKEEAVLWVKGCLRKYKFGV